jgi:hypothetical protein
MRAAPRRRGFGGPLASFVIFRVFSFPMRLVLAVWAGFVYAWYWLGYLRGQP